jgi:hypothetical protein
MPSLSSSPNDGDRPVVLGRGRLESGPARVDSASKLERRLAALRGEPVLVLSLNEDANEGEGSWLMVYVS